MGKSTIKTVWKKLSKEQSRNILSDIVGRGKVSIATAYAWVRGERRPLPLYQDLIAQVFSEHCGTYYNSNSLFS